MHMTSDLCTIEGGASFSHYLYFLVRVASVTPVTSTVAIPTQSSTSEEVTTGVIVAIVSCIVVLILFCAIMCVGTSIHYYYNRAKVINLHVSSDVSAAASNGTYSMKPTISPQPVCSQSVTASNFSINTMETGSTRVDKMSDSRLIKQRLSTISTDPSNPPNSPITERSIAFHIDSESIITTPNNDNDIISVATRPVPRVPNPSVDYEADGISENISSVSQRRFPGAIPHTSMLPPLYQDDIYDPNHNHAHHPHPAHLQYMMDYEEYSSYPPVFLPGDNISESTVSMATYEGGSANGYTTSSYMTNSHIVYKGERERRDLYQDNKTLEEERMGGYYDCPPPPSPVTEYSIHGD